VDTFLRWHRGKLLDAHPLACMRGHMLVDINSVAIRLRPTLTATVAITFLAFMACHQAPTVAPPQGEQLASTCPPANSSNYYVRLEKGGYLQRWASQILRSADAAPLWCGAQGPTTFRLLYLPSHRAAMIVSISESERNWLGQTGWTASTVRFENPRSPSAIDATRAFLVADRNKVTLTVAETKGFLDAIKEHSFWNSPSWQERGVDDGTIILIEGHQDGLYRAVGRWSTDASMFELASVFSRTAQLSVTAELEDLAYRLNKQELQPRNP
jgi:hypothetical protein